MHEKGKTNGKNIDICRFCFGDKVYARHYKKLTNTWENKPGYVAGHSGKMVWIAEELITSVYCVVSHKYNRNVLRR